MGQWGMLANVQACWRQGGVLITGCMHFVKCRTINLGNYLLNPPPMLLYLLSLSPDHTNKYFPSGMVRTLSLGNKGDLSPSSATNVVRCLLTGAHKYILN